MTAVKVINFPKQQAPQPKQEAGKSMYSDKFEQGYVMSSRLYRKEVWPFLSDAARNVYAELENRINGHNKESDFVSYSQLQGGKLENSRKLSSKTVTNGIKELIKLGVIAVVASGKQGVKSYRINEVSLIDHFTKESASPSTALYLVKHDHFTKESTSTLPSKDTIDNTYRNIYREESAQQNPIDEVLNIWKPDLHQLNSWMQRSGLPKINQAQVDELLLEVNPHYENKIRTGAVTDTQMYSNFVKWIKRDNKLVEKLMQQAASANAQPVIPQNYQSDMGDW